MESSAITTVDINDLQEHQQQQLQQQQQEEDANIVANSSGHNSFSSLASRRSLRRKHSHGGGSTKNNRSRSPKRNCIDPKLNQDMRQFLDDGPMRFGPAVIPGNLHVRQNLMEGSGNQLATYVRLRTHSDIKKKLRGLTDSQILRIVQFCQQLHPSSDVEADAAAYSLMKLCKPYYFGLTAVDRQFSIQERRVIVPIPQLHLKDQPNSRVVYFRPSRYFPKRHGYHKADVLDTLIYILDNWTLHDTALMTGTQNFVEAVTNHAVLIHLQDFGMANYSKDYWSKLMALLQGRVFPVSVRTVLWVDPPKVFDRVWSSMRSSMMITKSFRENNHRITQQQLGDYLQPQFAKFLPIDEFPDLCRGDEESNNLAGTFQSLARDYILFQKYLETLQGKTGMETNGSTSRRGRRGGHAKRRFSLPLYFGRRRRHRRNSKQQQQQSKRNQNYAVAAVAGEPSLDGSNSHDYSMDSAHESPRRSARSIMLGKGRPPIPSTSESINEQDDDQGDNDYYYGGNGREGNEWQYELEGESQSEASESKQPAAAKLQQPRSFRRHSQPAMRTDGRPPLGAREPSTRGIQNSQQLSPRRGVGRFGGFPVVHKHPRRSSLSVLEEMQEHTPANFQYTTETTDETLIQTPPKRKPRRLSLKSILSPLKIRRRRGGNNSTGDGSRKGDLSDSSGNLTNSDMDQSINSPLKDPKRRIPRRHSSGGDFFSHPSNQFLLEDDLESYEDMHDSGMSTTSNNESFDWNAILTNIQKNNNSGTPQSRSPKPARVSRRHSSAMGLPQPPLLLSDAEANDAKGAREPTPRKEQSLSYFLEQVERQKEKTRRLQMQRKAATASVP